MPTPRYYMRATGTPDGHIWIVGGHTYDSHTGGVPWGVNYIFNKLDMYNPTTDTWISKASMPSYRTALGL